MNKKLLKRTEELLNELHKLDPKVMSRLVAPIKCNKVFGEKTGATKWYQEGKVVGYETSFLEILNYLLTRKHASITCPLMAYCKYPDAVIRFEIDFDNKYE